VLAAFGVPAACDFDQLHNPNQATSTTQGGGGNSNGGAAGSTSGDGGSTTSSTTTAGAAGGGGAGGSVTGPGAGGGGAGGAGGALMDASAGAGGGADASACAGYALQFSGSSFATFARSISDNFTLEAWIKPSPTLPTLAGTNIWNGYGIIYADMPSTTTDFGTSIVNGKFAFGVGNPDVNVQSTTSIANGQWTHVAAVRNMTTGDIQVFLNGGAPTTLATTQKSSLTAPVQITLGADTLDSHYFIGVIDEVRVWNVVRTQADIMSTMHTRLMGTEAGLVDYYRFDEGTGTTAADLSPTHANAVLGGDAGAGAAPTWIMSDAPVCP
jgi:hypothetical protein